MDNLKLYNEVRTVPQTALREIQAGRLKGKSDINPMWRLKTLTEQFGPCGIGWKYVITKQWLEQGGNSEIAAFVNIDLYIKDGDAWSEAIPGTGGSMFAAWENKGIYENNQKVGTEKVLYISDECYKMALTDAISVACKALGFGADVYWNADKTKYDGKPGGTPKTNPQKQDKPPMGQEVPFTPEDMPPGFDDVPKATEAQLKKIYALSKQYKLDANAMKAIMSERYSKENSKDLTKKEASDLITHLEKV